MKKLFILLTILLLANRLEASPPSRSYSYVSGASISPTEVSANEDSIYTYLNAGVDTYKANSITGSDLISSLAITSSGNMTFSGTTNISGTLQLGGTAITSSAAELNKTDGLNSTTAELNILNGATLSTTELNYVDNVTSAIQTQLDGKSATTGNASIATVGTITTGTWTGTAIAVANGGTGATTVAGAKTNLSLTIGTDVQAYDAQLSDVAGLTATDNGVIIGNGSNFVVESGATLKTSLGLTIGTNVQAYNANTTVLGSDISLTAEVSGVLPYANGGRGTSGVRAYLSTDQLNITDASDIKILLDTESFDLLGEFASNRFTATLAGYYLVVAQVGFEQDTVIIDKKYAAQIWKNGAVATTSTAHSSSAGAVTATVSDIIYLAVGNYIELYTRIGVGANTVDVNSGVEETFLSIMQI